MTGQPVLRLCASYELLPREHCVYPERCLERCCVNCQRLVHYDPRGFNPDAGYRDHLLRDLYRDAGDPNRSS